MDCTVEDYLKEFWPFIGAIVLVDIVLIFFPDLVLMIPDLIFGKE